MLYFFLWLNFFFCDNMSTCISPLSFFFNLVVSPRLRCPSSCTAPSAVAPAGLGEGKAREGSPPSSSSER